MKRILLFFIVAFIFTACIKDDDEQSLEEKYKSLDLKAEEVDKNLVDSNTDFALKIFNEILKDGSDENSVISPLSISMAFSMLYNGAAGENANEIGEVLGYTGYDINDLNSDYKNLIESLEEVDEDLTVNISDSLWIRNDFTVKETYKDLLKNYYQSDIMNKDFSDDATVSEIKSWISDKTNGMIKNMIKEIDDAAAICLINAVYFNGMWKYQFETSNTYEEDFTKSNDETVTVDMMCANLDVKKYVDSDVNAVRLPYGRDKIALYAFVPENGVDAFLSDMNSENLNSYIENFVDVEGYEVYLPKFKIDYSVEDLSNKLAGLGMNLAFEGGDFTNISDNGVSIRDVLHKAVIDLNESGTEAAGVTVIGMSESEPQPSDYFKADKPFFFVIRDDRTETILFMGVVEEPKYE